MRRRIITLYCALSYLCISAIQGQTIPDTIIDTCDVDFPIPDNECTTNANLNINVSGLGGLLLGNDVILKEVKVIIAHSWSKDLRLAIQSPNGVWVELSNRIGIGGEENYGNPTDETCTAATVFTREACISIQEAEEPYIGAYLPTGDLNLINDGSPANGNWVFQACDVVPANSDGLIKHVSLVFSANGCYPITNAQVIRTLPEGVELTWSSPNAACDSLFLEYGPPGFQPGNGGTAGAGQLLALPCPVPQPMLLSQLSPFTEYEIYLRENCGNGNYSANSCPVLFQTECITVNPTIADDFEGQSLCNTQSCLSSCPINGITWQNTVDDDSDWIVANRSTRTTGTGPRRGADGSTNFLYTEANDCDPGAAYILRSNCIQVDASANGCHLSFYYHMFGSGMGSLHLEISQDDGDTWTELWSASGTQGGDWLQQLLDLQAYDGQTVRFRFRGVRGPNFRSDMALDQIAFYGPQDLGPGDFVYYRDADGDGYGDNNQVLQKCASPAPAGYVEISGDCNDNEPGIHPSAIEILCNTIDENCNGIADDTTLALPQPLDIQLCSSEPILLTCAQPAQGGYYWYDHPASVNPIGSGQQLLLPPQNSSRTYYVKDSLDAGCQTVLVPLDVQVDPHPTLIQDAELEGCPEDTLWLDDIPIRDTLFSGALIEYYDGQPFDSAHLQEQGFVLLSPGLSLWALAGRTSNCADTLQVDLAVRPYSEISIIPDDIVLCAFDSTILRTEVGASATPPTYDWNTGATTDTLFIEELSPQAPSIYSVTLTDANGCTATDDINLQALSSISRVAITNRSSVTECDGDDGAITLAPLNGFSPYTYHWEGPVSGTATNISGEYQITGLKEGNYRITISDNSQIGCAFVLSGIIVNGPAFTVDPDLLIKEVSCAGLADGEIRLNILSGDPEISWNTGDTSAWITDLSPGNYAVTLTSGNCTQVIDAISIQSPAPLDLKLEILQQAACPEVPDGAIRSLVNGGSSPYQYAWSNDATTPTLQNLNADSYQLTLTDVNGCIGVSDLLDLTYLPALNLSQVDEQMPSCHDSENGALAVLAEGGSGNYQYRWIDGPRLRTWTGLDGGRYEAIVQDSRGCSDSLLIDLDTPLPIQVSGINIVPPTCPGSDDAAILVSATGGRGILSYSWQDGGMGPERTGLVPDQYFCTITDANDCMLALPPLDVTDAPLAGVSSDVVLHPLCKGLDNGEIALQIDGLLEEAHYYLSDGSGNSVDSGTTMGSIYLEDLSSGIYQMQVFQSGGCLLYEREYILENDQEIKLLIQEAKDQSCFDRNDGYIRTDPQNANGNIDILWSNGDSGTFIDRLESGFYQATMTDAQGCETVTDSIILSAPDPMNFEVLDIGMPGCSDGNDGFIEMSVSGATPPYLFSWNDGLTNTEDHEQARARTYVLAVRDANNCVFVSDSIEVGAPDPLELELEELISVGGCGAQPIGQISIGINGGSPPVKLEWSHGDTSQIARKLEPGIYLVTATDAKGCIDVLEAEVEQDNPNLLIGLAAIDSLACHNDTTGRIVPRLLNGTGPFQFNWSNGSTDSINTQLNAGRYQLTVTDNFGCVGITEEVILVNPDPLFYELRRLEPATCAERNDGAITFLGAGGTRPYHIIWEDSIVSNARTDLYSGLHQVTIQDGQGCRRNFEVEVPGPEPVFAEASRIIPVKCHGDSTGIIIPHYGGGNPGGFSFLWSTGDTVLGLTNLAAGNYTVTVTDELGCSGVSDTLRISQPQAPLQLKEDSLRVFGDPFCSEGEGFIIVRPSGGTAPYTYYWSDGSRDSARYNLSSGNYQLLVEDALGCDTDMENFMLTTEDSIRLVVEITIQPNAGEANGEVLLHLEGGRSPYQVNWNGDPSDTLIQGVAPGWHYIEVMDDAGCMHEDSILIDAVVNVHEYSMNTVQVYPNPVRDYLVVDWSENGISVEKLVLYDPLGRLLFREEIPKSHTTFGLKTAALNEGVYWVELWGDQGVLFSASFVKF